jgi:hypothetical protein
MAADFSGAEDLFASIDCPIKLGCGDGKGNIAQGYLLLNRAGYVGSEARIKPFGNWYTVPIYKDSSAHLRALYSYLNDLGSKRYLTGFGEIHADMQVMGNGGTWRIP